MLSGYTEEQIAKARAAILKHTERRLGMLEAAGRHGIHPVIVDGGKYVAVGMGLRTHDPAATKAKALITWAYGDVVPI